MKFKKIYFLVLISILLTGCIQSTALLSPSITAATTGNIMQASLQYGANTAIKNETGKDPLTHLKDIVEEEKDSQIFRTKLKDIAYNTVDRIKKKLIFN
jgi:hypothetical protein